LRSRPSNVAIACLGLASFGIVLTTLGASLPAVMSRFAIGKAQAGTLLSVLSLGVLGGSLVFGPIVDRRGYKNLLIFAFITIIIGLEAIAFAPSVGFLTGAVLLIGFSGGMLNGSVNALVSDVSSPERRAATLTFVGAFFGVGAAGVPLVLAVLSDTLSHATILAAIAPVILVPLVLSGIASFPPSKQPHGFPLADARRLVRDPWLLVMGLILFLESGVESTVGGWITTFFIEELHAGVERAPLYLSLFWLGLLVARLTLGRVLRRTPPVHVIFGSLALSLASALLLVMSRGSTTAAVAVFLLGCGLAGTFPIVLGFVGDRYAHLSGTALGVVFGMALVGGMVLPYVAGVLGGARGMRVSLLLVPVCLLLQSALFVWALGSGLRGRVLGSSDRKA
jgi:FHS family glucose/mannose:H+ symporter-like MFS transporter